MLCQATTVGVCADVDQDGVCDVEEILGAPTSWLATSMPATEDDGSCVLVTRVVYVEAMAPHVRGARPKMPATTTQVRRWTVAIVNLPHSTSTVTETFLSNVCGPAHTSTRPLDLVSLKR